MKTNLFLKIHTYIHWRYICNTYIHKHTHTSKYSMSVLEIYVYRESKQIAIHMLIFNINRFSFLNALNGHLTSFSSSSPHISYPPRVMSPYFIYQPIYFSKCICIGVGGLGDEQQEQQQYDFPHCVVVKENCFCGRSPLSLPLRKTSVREKYMYIFLNLLFYSSE